MKQAELFHPRVFHDPEWAEGYYNRNRKNIRQVGKRLAAVLKQSGFSEGKILDVGCGFASVPIEIAREIPGAEITGIDLSEPLLEKGRSLVAAENMEKQITLMTGDAEDLKFETGSFEVVINSFLLHIVENPVKMLDEIERVTKPGGKILITDLRRGTLAWFLKKFRTAYTLEEAKGVIKNSRIRKGRLSRGFFWWDFFSF